jgi:hypothetical protein
MPIVSMSVVKSVAGTITDTAKTLAVYGFTAAEIAQADMALITVEADVRYRLDGTAPTASVGHIIKAQVDTEVRGYALLDALQLIRVGGSNVTAFITLGKL